MRILRVEFPVHDQADADDLLQRMQEFAIEYYADFMNDEMRDRTRMHIENATSVQELPTEESDALVRAAREV
jgi:hypothetical protein